MVTEEVAVVRRMGAGQLRGNEGSAHAEHQGDPLEKAWLVSLGPGFSCCARQTRSSLTTTAHAIAEEFSSPAEHATEIRGGSANITGVSDRAVKLVAWAPYGRSRAKARRKRTSCGLAGVC